MLLIVIIKLVPILSIVVFSLLIVLNSNIWDDESKNFFAIFTNTIQRTFIYLQIIDYSLLRGLSKNVKFNLDRFRCQAEKKSAKKIKTNLQNKFF